jgi:hypothetical protein
MDGILVFAFVEHIGLLSLTSIMTTMTATMTAMTAMTEVGQRKVNVWHRI